MGNTTNFKINDDGSISVENQLNQAENNILTILRVEQAKGGAFAPRRMKKRAIEYAKEAGVSMVTVDKLMLDNYPDDFRNCGHSNLLFFLLCGMIFFFCLAVMFGLSMLSNHDLGIFFVISLVLFLLGLAVFIKIRNKIHYTTK